MEWLNLKISALRSPEYIGSTPVERATWINVLAWCAEQENGGLILGGAAWKDRQWQQTCGVTAREVRAASKLIVIFETDLHVYGYPTDKQDQVQHRRQQAAEAARIRWEKQLGITSRNAPRNASTHAPRITPRNAEGEEEGELELEGEKEAHRAPSSELPIEVEFPPTLRTPEFSAAWVDWLAYRLERRLAKYKPRTASAQLEKLSEWGEPAAIASIRDSIRNQWQGLFEPKGAARKTVSVLDPQFRKF